MERIDGKGAVEHNLARKWDTKNVETVRSIAEVIEVRENGMILQKCKVEE
jgi:hypothetical protein